MRGGKSSSMSFIIQRSESCVSDMSYRASGSLFFFDPEKNPKRALLQVIMENSKTEYALSIIIMLNLMLLVVETDVDKDNGRTPLWIELINTCMLAFFSIEMVLRIFTYRSRILKDAMTILDVTVISLDLLFTLLGAFLTSMPPVSVMRIVRLMRLTRTTKIIKFLPQLHIIVLSLAGAATPLFWGGVMLILLLASWGILAVQIINPVIEKMVDEGGFSDCDRCRRSFESVWQSSLTLIQTCIAGDSWGTVALPVIEHSPWAIIFFGIVFITLTMALMNIILANVVDAVMQARLANNKYLAELRRKDRKEAKSNLLSICKALDSDDSGCLSYDEFKLGYEQDQDFRTALNAMDIKKEDLDTVWGILDDDESGDVSYTEFCDQLFKLKSSDAHTVLMFIKAYIADVRRQVNDGLKLMKTDIMGGIDEALTMMRKDDGLLQRISSKLHHESDKLAADDALPKEPDVSYQLAPLSPGAFADSTNQKAAFSLSSQDHDLAMYNCLEAFNKLETRLDTNIEALSSLIATASRTCMFAVPQSCEQSSRCGEVKSCPSEQESSRYAGANRTPNGEAWLPFAMCCNGRPPTNITLIPHETAQHARDTEIGRTLLALPSDRARRVAPTAEGNDAKKS